MMVESVSSGRRLGGAVWIEPQEPPVRAKLDYVDRRAGRREEEFFATSEPGARAEALLFVREHGVRGFPFKIDLVRE